MGFNIVSLSRLNQCKDSQQEQKTLIIYLNGRYDIVHAKVLQCFTTDFSLALTIDIIRIHTLLGMCVRDIVDNNCNLKQC